MPLSYRNDVAHARDEHLTLHYSTTGNFQVLQNLPSLIPIPSPTCFLRAIRCREELPTPGIVTLQYATQLQVLSKCTMKFPALIPSLALC
ncbi:unnamed protein product [Ixodes persulcatus]